MSKVLSRADILGAADLRTETVAVPEWGGDVIVRAMSGAERDAYEQQITEENGDDRTANLHNFRAKLVAFSIVNEAGNLEFSPADIEDLGKKSAKALQRVYNVASRLSLISASDVQELTAALKNGQSDGSGSDSHSLSVVPSPKSKTA